MGLCQLLLRAGGFGDSLWWFYMLGFQINRNSDIGFLWISKLLDKSDDKLSKLKSYQVLLLYIRSFN